jgi:condensin complex subunit 2
VHSNALKVLGGLGRSEQVDEGDDMDDDADPTDTPKAKTRTKKVSSANVIEANLENINLKKDSNSFTVDPMFHIMSAKFDEGGARGLLMHNLHVSWEGGITFDSAAPAGTDGQPAESGESHCAASLIDALLEVAMPEHNMSLCPEFEQYQNTIKGEESESGCSLDNNHPPSSSEINDMLPYESDEEDCGMADDWNDGGEQEDFSVMEQQGADNTSPALDGLADRSAPEVLASQVAMLEAIQDGYADYSSEYSFFGKMQACWVGAAAQRLHTFKSAMAPQAKKKAEKTPFSINFDGIDEMDFGKSYDIPSRVGLDQQTDASITKQYNSKQELLLPSTDHQFGLRNFTSLFLRPTTALRDSGKVTAGGASEVCVDQWNYDNPADAANYTANDMEGCAMDGVDDDDGFDDEMGGDFGFDAGDLIAEPSKVAKIQVNFDRVARQLDVKRLKECMWKQLTDEPKEEEEHHTFSQVVSDVPKVIPAEMLPNVSVPYCFICLLHLANEKNLEITDQRENEVNNLAELTIKLDAMKAA